VATPTKDKVPFYKNWTFWFGACVFLAVLGQVGEASKKGKEGSERTSTSVKSMPNGSDARRFVEKRLTNTVGKVIEIRQVHNGAYFGFPTGPNVFTFDGTCGTKYGLKNVVIAVESSDDAWEVVKIHIN